MAWCDNTGESLALLLRAGSAGSNTVSDHIEVLDEAITQVPASAWDAVLDTHGDPRDLDEAGVVEVTGLLREHPDGDQLANWPADMRIIARREKPHPGAQLRITDVNGHRIVGMLTNTPGGQLPELELRQRRHARVEDRTGTGKDTSIGHLPSTSIDINRAWCLAATIAVDLLAWFRLLCLEGPLAKAEPKTLRYRLLHTAARIVHGQRKNKIRIPETWPWAPQLQACFTTAFALPPPA